MVKEFPYSNADLADPTLQSMKALGGSGTTDEIEEEVIKFLKLPDEVINAIHSGGKTTKLSYRLAWARNFLKRGGFIENSARGVWSLTAKGQATATIDGTALSREVSAKSLLAPRITSKDEDEDPVDAQDDLKWQERIGECLMTLDPGKFARFCQRLLRELGFGDVRVTGRTGDGGIDGKGLVKVGGVLAFHIVFQCKRYKGSVSSSQIRDFRGAMAGRGDKGLFITTGTFTRDAKREAQRDGAPPIDLLDGVQIAEQMRVLKLGVRIELVEQITVLDDWFAEF